jgi:gas vesicle protein
MRDKKSNYMMYLTGGLVGAIVGVFAAYLLDKNDAFEEEGTGISRKKISKLGFSTISMLWSLIDKGKSLH